MRKILLAASAAARALALGTAAAQPQGRPAARSEGGKATGSEDIAPAEAGAEHKP